MGSKRRAKFHGIEDVPCRSCQEGYGSAHTCEHPEHCPCDQKDLHQLTEDQVVKQIVDPSMVEFASQMQSALGKLKDAHETQTNCLLLTKEVEALLGYMQSVQAHLRAIGEGKI